MLALRAAQGAILLLAVIQLLLISKNSPVYYSTDQYYGILEQARNKTDIKTPNWGVFIF